MNNKIARYKNIGLLILASALVQMLIIGQKSGIIINCTVQVFSSLAFAIFFYYLFNQKLKYTLVKWWEIFFAILIFISILDKFLF